MKVNHILEAANVNMSFLKDVTRMVLSKIPSEFNRATDKTITLSASDIKELIKKYPQKEKTPHEFEDVLFVFVHHPINLNVLTFGQYNSATKEITINVTAIAETTENITLKDLKDKRKDTGFGLLLSK